MDFAGYRRIVVLTGAGLSRSAGLPTYRGPGGLWSDAQLAQLSHVSALASRRAEVCQMFWTLRQAIAGAAPTAAHRALAAFEARLAPGATLTVLTQNVDGFHQAAGSRAVCELHGSLARWRCDECQTELVPAGGDAPVHCDQPMRPSVVLFGEALPLAAERTMKHALRDCDLFVAIGTSGTVEPAASLVRWAALNPSSPGISTSSSRMSMSAR